MSCGKCWTEIFRCFRCVRQSKAISQCIKPFAASGVLCREYRCKDVAEAAIKLRDTYIAAARTGKMSMAARMFTVRMTDDLGILDLMCCIPVDESFDGAERMEFDETHALCIYYRGPYEGTAEAMRVLMEHVSKNGINPQDWLRSVYLEGPPNRGDNSADYITQIAVPIKKFEKV